MTTDAQRTITKLARTLTTPLQLDNDLPSRAYKTIRTAFTEYPSTSETPKHPDEDMSDLAIAYYQAIYPGVFSYTDHIIGDTMNSFNTTANRIPEAGASKTKRTPESQWPHELIAFHNAYHCLANFWILPSAIGRSPTSIERTVLNSPDTIFTTRGLRPERDYVSNHINTIRRFMDSSPRPRNPINDYYAQFGTGQTGYMAFIAYHDLQDYIEPNGDPIDLQSLQPTEYCELATRLIHKRAIRLAEHHTDALLTVFHDYNEDTDL
jgi:hypothetical protein